MGRNYASKKASERKERKGESTHLGASDPKRFELLRQAYEPELLVAQSKFTRKEKKRDMKPSSPNRFLAWKSGGGLSDVASIGG